MPARSRGRWVLPVGLAALALFCGAGRHGDAEAQEASPGGPLFAEHCASCHDHPQDRIPPTAALRTRAPDEVVRALRSGIMRAQAQGLSIYQMQLITAYLTGVMPEESRAAGPESNPCPSPAGRLRLDGPAWNGWGRDPANSRYQPRPGFGAAEVPRLRLKWAFGYRGSYAYGQPVVVGGRVFVTSSTGRVYSLDARRGCTYWTYDGEAASRTAVTIAALGRGGAGGAVAVFGDDGANVYALDAASGELRWKVRVDVHPLARITGAPKVHAGRVYVPVSSLEEVAAISKSYPCCTFVGKVVALDLATGSVLWVTPLAPAPQPLPPSDVGTRRFGPAGAAVWNSPTVDERRGLLYFGTGNSYTDVAIPASDAIVALDLRSGAVRWVRQLTPDDNFVVGCPVPSSCTPGSDCPPRQGNCPAATGPDFDFGASVILARTAGGRELLLASQKSGVVYGLDPAREGAVLWRRQVGDGSPLGGIEWGAAVDATRVYAPISDVLAPAGAGRAGLAAIEVATGKLAWRVDAPRGQCAWSVKLCPTGFVQAASVMPGVVFAGALDGHLRAFDAASGALVWDYDTAHPHPSVNGIVAEGGSLDLGGAVIVDGTLYVNSGYGRLIGQPGNALLAFSVDGR
jgi:polyvinyl alcohol dehydrogenase (cytochrome)